MSHRYQAKRSYSSYSSRRSTRRLVAKSKKNFIITLILIMILGYSMLVWVLPFFINGIGVVKNTVKPTQKITAPISQNANLAPPVLNIPYEATNASKINIKGYGTPDSKVKLYLDDEEKQTISVSDDGSFTFEDVALFLGVNNIHSTTVDDSDKESLPSKTIRLLYNNEKPTLKINEPEDNKTIKGGDKKVKISGKTDPGVKVFINSSWVIVDNDGNFSSEQSLNDGDNIFTIKANDIASNITELERKVIYQPE